MCTKPMFTQRHQPIAYGLVMRQLLQMKSDVCDGKTDKYVNVKRAIKCLIRLANK